MYAFTEDKSQWNVGNWVVLSLSQADFKPGIESTNDNIAKNKATKYVCEIDIASSDNAYLKRVLGEILNPMLIWAEVLGSSSYGFYENEIVESNGALIEDVYFQNQKIYVVASGIISANVYNIKIKGA